MYVMYNMDIRFRHYVFLLPLLRFQISVSVLSGGVILIMLFILINDNKFLSSASVYSRTLRIVHGEAMVG